MKFQNLKKIAKNYSDLITLFVIYLPSIRLRPIFSMIFVLLFHPSRTAAAALPILVFSVFRPLSANIRNEPRGLRLARLFFYFKTPRALSRIFLKFPIYLCPTRVNFSTASSTTIPHPAEGAALLCGRLPPSFSVSPFRPGNLGLFGALLQPPAPEKKKY